jgi:hypothetical protein
MNVVTSLLGLVIVSHLSPKGSGRFTVVPVLAILPLKVHQLVAILGSKLNRHQLLLRKQALPLDPLLLTRPPIEHASSVDNRDTMPTTVPTELPTLHRLQ